MYVNNYFVSPKVSRGIIVVATENPIKLTFDHIFTKQLLYVRQCGRFKAESEKTRNMAQRSYCLFGKIPDMREVNYFRPEGKYH